MSALSIHATQSIRPRWMKRVFACGTCLALAATALAQAPSDLLTPEERAWLKARSPIRWSTNINAPPYGFLKSDGHVDGISPDLMALLERQLGVEFKPIAYGSWPETLAAIKRGDCDFLTAAVPTEDRKQYLLFSQPYQEIPIVLFVNRSTTGIDNIKDLVKRRVGVARDTMTHEWMRREHPEVKAVPVETTREGMLLLSIGQLDAMAAGLPIGHHIIMHNALNNLRVPPTGKLFDAPYCLAARKNDERLMIILKKGMDNLSQPELRAVFSKWSVPELIQPSWQPPLWLKNSLLALMVGYVGFVVWTYLLRSRVAQQAKLIRKQVEQEREMEQRCAELIESATDMVYTRDFEGNYITMNPAGCRLLGYTPDEVKRLNISDVVLPEYMDAVRQHTAEKLAGEESTVYQVEAHNKDGRRIWLEASLRLFYKDGKPVGIQGIARDITQRKCAEAAADQERRFLRTLIDNMPDLVYTKDTKARFVLSNVAHLKFMGVQAESDLAGKTVLDLHPPELARGYYADDLHVLQTGEAVYNREELVRDHNGVTRWHLTIKAPLRDHDGAIIGIICISRDIDAHKRALEALRESEMLYHSLVEQLPQAIFRKDLEGRVTFANSHYCQNMQRELKDVLGKTDNDIFPPDLAAKYREDDKKVIETGVLFEAVERHRTPDGRWFYVHVMKSPLRDADGRIIGIQCIFWDITGRKLIEDALRESEQRLRLAMEAGQMGAWDRDLKTNKLYWSATTEKMMGFEPNTFPGTYEAFYELLHPDSRDTLAAAQQQARDTGFYSAELKFQLRDGRILWSMARGQVLYDEQGTPDRILGVSIDITKRKKAEDALAMMNEDLEQRVRQRTAELTASNKELEAFCYSVSHDLRAPLRSIDGFSALVLENCQGKLDAQSMDYLQRARAAAQQMGHLINDLLQLSRVTRCEMHHETVDLSALVSSITDDLKHSQPTRQIRFILEPQVTTLGDPRLLRIVLENLLNNAWKFTARQHQPRIEFGVCKENGLTTYFVRDNGAGFDMAYVHKLFVPFQRLHAVSDFPGTGVGLASAQRIIHRHGGQIRAEGAVDKGATFYFTLQPERAAV